MRPQGLNPKGKSPVPLRGNRQKPVTQVTARLVRSARSIERKNVVRAMQYGYGRVSTSKQDTALQEDAFSHAKVRRVVYEKWSSVGARPKLFQLLARLQPGDEVVCWKLDRVGRSLRDLLEILETIRDSGATFRSLTEPIDTSTPAGELLFSVLGAAAQYERAMIRERSIAGQVAALRRGVRIGRPKELSEAQEAEVAIALLEGEGRYQVARRYGVSYTVVQLVWWRLVWPEHPRVASRRPVLGRLLAA